MFRKPVVIPKRVSANDIRADAEAQIAGATRATIAGILETLTRMPSNWERRLSQEADNLKALAALRAQLMLSTMDQPTQQPHYQISSLFLRQCAHKVLPEDTGNEHMVLVTGSITGDGTRVLSHIVEVPIKTASPAYVLADPDATMRILIDLVERDGLPFLAMFHSHRMRGPGTTMPSLVDLNYQQRLVKIGCDALGGIINDTRDVRIFSTANDFTLSIFGNGVTMVTDSPRSKLLKIEEV